MAKYLLAGEDINWLAIFALVTFFILFTLAIVLVFSRNRQRYQEIAELPLNDETDSLLNS